MAKKKSEPAPEEPGKKGKGQPIGYRPSAEVSEALRDYREKHEYPPDRSEVIERALRMYLRSKGYDLPERPSESDE